MQCRPQIWDIYRIEMAHAMQSALRETNRFWNYRKYIDFYQDIPHKNCLTEYCTSSDYTPSVYPHREGFVPPYMLPSVSTVAMTPRPAAPLATLYGTSVMFCPQCPGRVDDVLVHSELLDTNILVIRIGTWNQECRTAQSVLGWHVTIEHIGH